MFLPHFVKKTEWEELSSTKHINTQLLYFIHNYNYYILFFYSNVILKTKNPLFVLLVSSKTPYVTFREEKVT